MHDLIRVGRMTFMLLLFLVSTLPSDEGKELFMPLNLQKAYEQDTRSKTGKPGPAYWTNRADYNIDVAFEPHTGLLRGQAQITYHNNSPDTLHRMVFRMYQDIFREGTLRDWPVAPGDLHEGIRVERILVEGDKVAPEGDQKAIRRRGANMFLSLPRPIEPEGSINLLIDWHVYIAQESNIRMGRYDSSSYFIAYWYPQAAVYDDIDGWDTYNFSGLQEFYNDFGDFDVSITVPQDFMVWATGTLQNPEKLLTEPYLKRYLRARKADSIVHIIREKDLGSAVLRKSDNGLNTWRFSAKDIPDFAFGLSDHYLWDGTSVAVDESGNRRVFVAAAYKRESQDFYDVTEIAREGVAFFSKELPGVPFPYPEITIFNGGGGMEFPMMVNDGSVSQRSGTVGVTTHEIAHTYFPFYMGTNERKYAWMDEGWAVMLPLEVQKRLADYDPERKAINRYLPYAGREMDVPMIATTIIYGSNAYRPAYRNAAYGRPAVAYLMLRDLLGEEMFKKALQSYIERWRGKHPMPFDFFYTFNDVSGQNLNWFWKPWFFEFGYPDLALTSARQDDDGVHFLVEKKGKLPIPVKVTFVYEDDSRDSLQYNLSVWKTAEPRLEKFFRTNKTVKSLELGDPHIPDVNKENNIIKLTNE